MKKNIFAFILLIAFFIQTSFAADQICGNIKVNEDSFTIDMAGGGTAFLYAEDGWIFKPLAALRKVAGSYACVTGEWHDNYTFIIIRVN